MRLKYTRINIHADYNIQIALKTTFIFVRNQI